MTDKQRLTRAEKIAEALDWRLRTYAKKERGRWLLTGFGLGVLSDSLIWGLVRLIVTEVVQ